MFNTALVVDFAASLASFAMALASPISLELLAGAVLAGRPSLLLDEVDACSALPEVPSLHSSSVGGVLLLWRHAIERHLVDTRWSY